MRVSNSVGRKKINVYERVKAKVTSYSARVPSVRFFYFGFKLLDLFFSFQQPPPGCTRETVEATTLKNVNVVRWPVILFFIINVVLYCYIERAWKTIGTGCVVLVVSWLRYESPRISGDRSVSNKIYVRDSGLGISLSRYVRKILSPIRAGRSIRTKGQKSFANNAQVFVFRAWHQCRKRNGCAPPPERLFNASARRDYKFRTHVSLLCTNITYETYRFRWYDTDQLQPSATRTRNRRIRVIRINGRPRSV